MKKYEQKTKKSSLTISPERFQQELGSGSFNTDCPTDTGKSIAAILKPIKGSSLQSENLWTSASAAMWPFPLKEKSQDESGIAMETVINDPTYSEISEVQDLLFAWKMSYLPTKLDKQD